MRVGAGGGRASMEWYGMICGERWSEWGWGEGERGVSTEYRPRERERERKREV